MASGWIPGELVTIDGLYRLTWRMNGEHRQEVNIEENLLLNDTLKSKIIKKIRLVHCLSYYDYIVLCCQPPDETAVFSQRLRCPHSMKAMGSGNHPPQWWAEHSSLTAWLPAVAIPETEALEQSSKGDKSKIWMSCMMSFSLYQIFIHMHMQNSEPFRVILCKCHTPYALVPSNRLQYTIVWYILCYTIDYNCYYILCCALLGRVLSRYAVRGPTSQVTPNWNCLKQPSLQITNADTALSGTWRSSLESKKMLDEVEEFVKVEHDLQESNTKTRRLWKFLAGRFFDKTRGKHGLTLTTCAILWMSFWSTAGMLFFWPPTNLGTIKANST